MVQVNFEQSVAVNGSSLSNRKKGQLTRLGVFGLLLLLGLSLLLSGCADYPGADPPCTGSQKNAPGCDPPTSGLSDNPVGGEWYQDWAFKIVQKMLSNLAIQAVQLSVSVFWSIYTNLSSTDFAGCGAGNGTGTPTCSAVEAFSAIRTVAFVFFPLIMLYRTFKSYFLGQWIEGWYESFLAICARLLIAGFCIASLEVIMTGAFGISNQLFNAISGGPEGLNEIAKAVVGHGWSPGAPPGSILSQPAIGVLSVEYVVNVGLLIFILIICLLMALVFIFLGVVFLLRTVLVFILFAMSPLGVLAGTLDEFKPWFFKWFQSVQAMLIAPLPVAICFRLIGSFAQNVPSAHDNPPEFILTMVYIICFLAIGALLMFKIAGALGGVLFGALTAAAGFAVGGIVGGIGGLNWGLSRNGGADEQAKTAQEKKKVTSGTSQLESGSGGDSEASGLGGSGAGSPGFGLQERKQQMEMASALRTLTETMKASSFSQSSPLPTPRFSHAAHDNFGSVMRWAGEEAGVSAPYLSLAPYRSRYGQNSGSNNLLIFQPSGQSETGLGVGATEGNNESVPPPSPADYESPPPQNQWPPPEPAGTAPPRPGPVERVIERNLTRFENSLHRRTL